MTTSGHGGRSRRRELVRARRRRNRILAGTAAALLAGSAIAVAITSQKSRDRSGNTTRPAVVAGRTERQVATVSGSKPSESTTLRQASARAPLRGEVIAIDPGHNGANFLHTTEINRLVDAGTLRKPCDVTGTQTAAGYAEAAYTLDVALRLRAILSGYGATVVMTRTRNDGWGPCITERAAIGNRAHAAAAISIHADGGPPSGRGFHVIYPPSLPGLTDDIAAASKRLAIALRGAFARGTGMPYATYIGHNGLDVRSDLGGLNLSDVPKVFIETGNMRNTTDAALLTSPAFRQREARAIAAGIRTFLER